MMRQRFSIPRQLGLSLIELMVSLALGAIIVAAMAELFVNISRSNQEMAKTNSQIENARFAMQLLGNDIIHAGYWGGFLPEWDDFAWEDPLPYTSVDKQDPCQSYPWSAATVNSFISMPIEVFDDITGTSCGSTGVIDLAHLQANTDVVVVRHANQGEATVGDPNDTLYFQVSNCDLEYPTNAYALSKDPNELTLREMSCLTSDVATTRKWVQNIYYIRDYAVTPGDGIPTLMRSRFGVSGSTPEQLSADALVEGIERFHVELGFDRRSHTGGVVNNWAVIDWADPDYRTMPTNRGNGVAEGQFERCLSNESACTADDLTNVVSVKLFVLARAAELTSGYSDEKTYSFGTSGSFVPTGAAKSFKRHVFNTTIRLNNVSGRRDTPYDPNGI